MKKLYWRPQRVSSRVLALMCLVAICALFSVETFRVTERQSHYRDKTRAAQTALHAFRALKAARLRLGIPIDPETDPAGTGLIGELLTPITTNTGHAGAKQTSVNPNFAAVIVDQLRRAGVARGDAVAIGLSGSFPALNVCALAAVQTLGVKPVIISSVGASQWGANHPSFTWPDMERVLLDQRITPFRSVAVSPGGIDDRGVGLSPRGKEAIAKAIERNGAIKLEPASFAESLDQRMALYQEHAEGEIRAYINVGGGTISVGTRVGKELFRPGLNLTAPRGPTVDSVMSRFASQGVPVIHLIQVDELAKRYGLPLQPSLIPPVGEGTVFMREVYSRWLAAAALLVLFATLAALLRFDLGHRLLKGRRKDAPSAQPEPMV